MEMQDAIKRANNPGESTVGVWLNGVNLDFVGSAFFVMPSIVLTARHVVQERTDHEWGSMRENLYLGPLEGKTQVLIDSSRIDCHPEYDIALIRLKHPQGNQPCASVAIAHKDYRGHSVICYGIDKYGGDRDPTDSYKIGTQREDGYAFHHSVKEGFSGCAAAIDNRAEVVGVVSWRRISNQESLFVPLYLIDDWLKNLAIERDDPEIRRFFEESRPRTASLAVRNNLIQDIQGLAIFVERPKEAFDHVVNEVIANERGFKLCLCLSTSGESDCPRDFARALALKLSDKGAADSGNGLLELVQTNAFDVGPINDDVWRSKNYEEFRGNCLKAIYESLQRRTPRNPPKNDDDYRREIRDLLQGLWRPKVLLMVANQRAPEGLWRRFNRAKAIRTINRRFEWLKRFNREWFDHFKEPGPQPLVGLFCIFANPRDVKPMAACFRLNTITEKNFNDWLVAIEIWLKLSGGYHDGHLFVELTALFKRVADRFNAKNLRFPITYEDFKSGIEETGRSYEGEGK